MGYTEVIVIWAGAVDAIESFTDESAMEAFIGQAKLDAADTDEVVEIFTIYHDHGRDIECECAQYVTDHRPYWTNQHTGHYSQLGGTYWCDTCNSPYCDNA